MQRGGPGPELACFIRALPQVHRHGHAADLHQAGSQHLRDDGRRGGHATQHPALHGSNRFAITRQRGEARLAIPRYRASFCKRGQRVGKPRPVGAHRFEATAERTYNVGLVFKRAQGRGKITRIVGLDEFVARHRAHLVEETLLRPGTPRRDWKSTLLSDGYLVVRHPDWDTTRAMTLEAATDIHLYAS